MLFHGIHSTRIYRHSRKRVREETIESCQANTPTMAQPATLSARSRSTFLSLYSLVYFSPTPCQQQAKNQTTAPAAPASSRPTGFDSSALCATCTAPDGIFLEVPAPIRWPACLRFTRDGQGENDETKKTGTSERGALANNKMHFGGLQRV